MYTQNPNKLHNADGNDTSWKRAVRRSVRTWYSRNARTFLWRSKNPDPYIVLVSETMLQQTQTSRVQGKLPEFLALFPSFDALASASNAAIIRAWQGMGYNSRALRLRDCASAVVRQHNGCLPDDYVTLRSLPGVGDYTANAILAFAYHKNVAVIDVNIKRVYSRLLRPMATTHEVLAEGVLRPFAETVVPQGGSSTWHQAIMDIGALFCTARKPKCNDCPLQKLCASAGSMAEAQPPRKTEPMHRLEPNRIWRGRTVELLRNLPHGMAIPVRELMNRLLTAPHTTDDEHWFAALLGGLQRDGIAEEADDAVRLKE
ncbi:MAG: A/G-specific adenine glycosylase [Candidatus Kapabacteria bacterium]|nr:A/G-specific adenine glycosylase [Candidatus Kapabacteria bacterium]